MCGQGERLTRHRGFEKAVPEAAPAVALPPEEEQRLLRRNRVRHLARRAYRPNRIETLLFEASLIYDTEGAEALVVWEATLTDEERAQLDAEVKAFAEAMGNLARVAKAAGISLQRIGEP